MLSFRRISEHGNLGTTEDATGDVTNPETWKRIKFQECGNGEWKIGNRENFGHHLGHHFEMESQNGMEIMEVAVSRKLRFWE